MSKYILLFLIALSLPGISQEKTRDHSWSWVETNYSLCENIGIHGTYRVHVEARSSSVNNDEFKLNGLALWIESGAVTKGSCFVSAAISVEKNNRLLQTVRLARPSELTIERQPKANESMMYYLPKDKVIVVPKGAVLVFNVSVIIKTEAGSCSLGNSKKTIDPRKS